MYGGSCSRTFCQKGTVMSEIKCKKMSSIGFLVTFIIGTFP